VLIFYGLSKKYVIGLLYRQVLVLKDTEILLKVKDFSFFNNLHNFQPIAIAKTQKRVAARSAATLFWVLFPK